MPSPHSHRPLPHPLRPVWGNPRLRRGLFAAVALASVTLLGGCSIWPKALTWGSDPLPAQEQPVQPTVAAPPSPAAPAPVEPKPEVTATAVTAPAKVEPLPPAKLQPQAPAPVPQIVMTPKTVPATGLVHGFYINVGLFAVPGNGRNAYQKLEAAGLPVFSDGIQSKKGPLTRVRVGPFTTRAQADAAAKKIQTLQLAAIVFRH